jgi:hypothetical protein
LKRSGAQEFHCPICLDVFERPAELECGHTFCADCVQEVLQTSLIMEDADRCPLCRRPGTLLSARRRFSLELLLLDQLQPLVERETEIIQELPVDEVEEVANGAANSTDAAPGLAIVTEGEATIPSSAERRCCCWRGRNPTAAAVAAAGAATAAVAAAASSRRQRRVARPLTRQSGAVVDCFIALDCPWCYLAVKQLPVIAARTGCRFVLRPVQRRSARIFAKIR